MRRGYVIIATALLITAAFKPQEASPEDVAGPVAERVCTVTIHIGLEIGGHGMGDHGAIRGVISLDAITTESGERPESGGAVGSVLRAARTGLVLARVFHRSLVCVMKHWLQGRHTSRGA